MEWRGKWVTVMGLGSFGGGVGVTRFLASRGARVTVSDSSPAEKLGDSLKALDGLDVTLHLGGHLEGDFTEADLVVVNPAVKPDSPFLRLASDRGVALETEMNLFFRLCPAPIAAVTGSNGKSTTTALLAAMLQQGPRRAWLGGNIGKSLLEDLDEIRADDLVVLEMSSFQLERLAWIERSPHLALPLNLAPNHLDWHGTMAAYAAAKQNILRFQRPGDLAVLCDDDAAVRTWDALTAGAVWRFSGEKDLPRGAVARDGEVVLRTGADEERYSLARFAPPGPHNALNAAAAALAARLLGAPPDGIQRALDGFTPLPHRLELVAEVRGVRYYDDSVATTPESALVALRSFERPVIILGGYDKKLPFDALGREAAQRARAVILIGAAADRIAEAIPAEGRRAEVVRAATFEEAVRLAAERARPGDAVLLSPACASYDMFRNYEHRAEVFRQLVSALPR